MTLEVTEHQGSGLHRARGCLTKVRHQRGDSRLAVTKVTGGHERAYRGSTSGVVDIRAVPWEVGEGGEDRSGLRLWIRRVIRVIQNLR